MTIPQGATHVDADGDYWRVVDGRAHSFDEDMGCFPKHCMGHPFDDAHYKWNLQPIVSVERKPYKDQFEPWVPHWWVLPEGVTPSTVHSEVIANRAIQKAMRC